jgi:hypothetical protein
LQARRIYLSALLRAPAERSFVFVLKTEHIKN